MKLQSVETDQIPPVVLLWAYRMLVDSHVLHEFSLADGHWRYMGVAQALGLHAWAEERGGEVSRKEADAELRRRHHEMVQQVRQTEWPRALRDNLSRLSGLLSLSEVDQHLLAFAVMLHNERLLDDVADVLGGLIPPKVPRALAGILDLPESQVREALEPKGLLARTGLLTLSGDRRATLTQWLDLLSEDVGQQLLRPGVEPLALLQNSVHQPVAGHLRMQDYAHAEASIRVLLPYLRHALENRKVGVNVLVYGPPGTGKTQLTRTLAKEVGCALYEVACDDEDGDPIEARQRLTAYRAAQSFFVRQRALIVFDEVEDVFSVDPHRSERRTAASSRKGWITRALEENPLPTIWLTNSLAGIDAALVRRFDLVFELAVPPRTQRREIVRNACGDLLDTAGIERMATIEALAPAVIRRAADVVLAVQQNLNPKDWAPSLEHLVAQTLEAQGHGPLPARQADLPVSGYDPAFIQADADLAAVAQGLRNAPSGRLCLYGPPGTGKTAYGQWLARQLERPLLIKRASDLMSKYVGETERNLARAFTEARMQQAVLMIDEVDSFLRDRRGASHSWEVTEVNEMLTQMESFDGVFVASTNLVDGLDAAALRRFDLKVKFDYLAPDQAWRLFLRRCRELALPMVEETMKPRLDRLHGLTPGDFAATVRRHRFQPFKCVEGLLKALEQEMTLKGQKRSVLGFTG